MLLRTFSKTVLTIIKCISQMTSDPVLSSSSKKKLLNRTLRRSLKVRPKHHFIKTWVVTQKNFLNHELNADV